MRVVLLSHCVFWQSVIYPKHEEVSARSQKKKRNVYDVSRCLELADLATALRRSKLDGRCEADKITAAICDSVRVWGYLVAKQLLAESSRQVDAHQKVIQV